MEVLIALNDQRKILKMIIFIPFSLPVLVSSNTTVYPYSNIDLVGDLTVGNKNGFNPAQTSGVQYFTTTERVTVLHKGGYLERIDPGQVVLVETKRVGDQRMFWFGRVTNTAYWFVLDEPVSIFDVTSWFVHHQQMIEAHRGDMDQFVDQCELPF